MSDARSKQVDEVRTSAARGQRRWHRCGDPVALASAAGRPRSGHHDRLDAELYGELFEAMMRYGDRARDRASDPQVVLDAVIDAIESPQPKARYLIGHSARLQSVLRRLPDKMRDRVILGALRRVAASSRLRSPCP